MSWNPLFGEIVDSSVWRLPLHVRVAWITVLAMKDFRTHKIRTNPYLLADKAKITEAQAAEALEVFLSPDKHSLNPDNEGRRLQKLDAGEYLVLNGAWWSKRMAKENKKQYDREYAESRRNWDNAEVAEVPRETLKYQDARPILHYLNEKCGTHYREVESNLSVIAARLDEPEVTHEGIRKMIDRMCSKWKGTQQQDYLRPITLFGKEKFDGYYATRELPIAMPDAFSKTDLRGGNTASDAPFFSPDQESKWKSKT